jgi:hypothetical protein
MEHACVVREKRPSPLHHNSGLLFWCPKEVRGHGGKPEEDGLSSLLRGLAANSVMMKHFNIIVLLLSPLHK